MADVADEIGRQGRRHVNKLYSVSGRCQADEGDDLAVTTFAGWLADQTERQDEVGKVAQLWKEISPGRVSSVVKVSEILMRHAEQNTLTWMYQALKATTEEYRAWKVNPEAASIAAPATRSQLDRIEFMLSRIVDALGIPMLTEVGDDTELAAMHEFRRGEAGEPQIGQYGLDANLMRPDPAVLQPMTVSEDGPTLVPYIKTAGGMGYREAGLAPSDLRAGVEAVFTPDGKPDWAKLYGLGSAVELPDDAELGEQAE